MRNYLAHWGLREPPFENTCPPEFFVASRRHREALERLYYVARDRNMGFGMLTGEVGCGKTFLARILKSRLPVSDYEVVLLSTTPSRGEDLLFEILRRLREGAGRRPASRDESPTPPSAYELLCRFGDVLEEKIVRPRRHLVLLLDEAQMLDRDALLTLRAMTNLAETDQNYLTALFFGQAELRACVRTLPQIDQRVGIRYHLSPLPAEEIGLYVDTRMRAAGYPEESAFAPEAKRELYDATGGFPREINRICKIALDRAFTRRERRIELATVRTIVDDVFRQNALAV